MKTKPCQNCGKHFPKYINTDGKLKNLQNRKFCFECSPLGSHNTSKNPTNKKDRKHRYQSLTKEQKQKYLQTQYKRRIENKNKLMQMFGGKCSICGYNKCPSAMHFHHIDSSQKKHGLSTRETGLMSWEALIKEAKKCQLLCANCHAELHYEKGSKETRTPNT